MTIEEQLKIVDAHYKRLGPQNFPASIYQACTILIREGMAEIAGLNEEGIPMLKATEIGIAQVEAWDQEALQ